MANKDQIIEAYTFLREHNHSIPSDVLEFMKDTSLNEILILESSKEELSKTSWAYFQKEYDKIEQLQQSQKSLTFQLGILRNFANKLGLYDAADFIRR